MSTAHSVTPRHPAIPARLGLGVALTAALIAFSCSSEVEDAPCNAGLADCGECTDLTSSLRHCGSCGNACAERQDCVGGTCQCVEGLTACGSACVNLASDPGNCGQCGKGCATGSVCSNGSCSSSCSGTLTQCGASCVDLGSSSTNCGTCNRACGVGQMCVNGACQCTQGRTDCGGACVDLAQDPQHCGRCSNACAAGSMCSSGSCQSSGSGGNGPSAGAPNAGAPSGGQSSGAGGASAAGGVTTGGTSGRAGAAGNGTSGSPSGGSSGACQATGFHVKDGAIYDVKCNEFVIRGINYPYAWYASRDTAADFNAIAATGANTVRIVLSNGGFMSGSERWTRTEAQALTGVLQAAKSAKLVAMVEVHDTTGYSEKAGAVQLSSATSYWTDSAIANVLKGQEAFVMINIGNEPNGNNTTDSWVSSHVTAVQALRSAGLDHTLVVDAPNWGQDWTNTMRDGAGTPIWQADTKKNLVFSVHMYEVYASGATVTSYFNTFLSRYDAPLIVGEFAADHGSSGDVDEATIMANAEMLSLGYLGWSWAGNSSNLSTLDIANNFSASSLSTWGTRLIDGANGIRMTSARCTCFN